MIRILTCLRDEHDPTLVILAAMIAMCGALISARLFRMTIVARGTRGIWFLTQSAVIGGATIWSTHFVAMLGFDPGIPHGYDANLTIASLAVATIGVLLGLLVSRQGRDLKGARRRLVGAAGGGVAGLGVVAMHHLGMASLLISADIAWDWDLTLLSALSAPIFGMMAGDRVMRRASLGNWLIGGGQVASGISLTHFLAMSAMTVAPWSTEPPVGASLIPDQVLAMLVLSVTALFLLVGLSSFLIDDAAQREHGRRMTHATLHDSLTGLPNRAALRRSLQDLLAAPQAMESGLVVVMMDLDRFKPINDVHGHGAGDHVLATLASRAAAGLKPGEILARAGADEFIALRIGAGASGGVEFARRLQKTMTGEVEWEGRNLSTGVSLGVALAPQHGDDVETLLTRADLAMHRAKRDGNGRIVIYDPRMDEISRARSALTMELKTALAEEQFELFFQPQVELSGRRIVGFEALLRWRHPVRGLVSPDEFIPLAESTGLIRDIGAWAMREACRVAMQWPDPIRVAVNVAPRQLGCADFAECALDALLTSGLPPERLELELTETSLIEDADRGKRLIAVLKQAGVRVAMDDYGTGYASLATLNSFPFDKIKIDRGFVQNLPEDRQAAAIVRSTLILAGALGIPVLAEGVETEEQVAFLRQEGCAEAQGFLFGRPEPVSRAETLLRAQQTHAALRAANG